MYSSLAWFIKNYFKVLRCKIPNRVESGYKKLLFNIRAFFGFPFSKYKVQLFKKLENVVTQRYAEFAYSDLFTSIKKKKK